jgi:hypothetical protein
MKRKVFYSFEFDADAQRAAQVRSMGVIEGNAPATDNEWEAIRGNDTAIERWIKNQMEGKSVVVVLAGATTAKRKWVDYEIKTGWSLGKGILGIHIHNLKNLAGVQSKKGANPFSHFKIGSTALDSIVKTYDPPFADSKLVYGHIQENLAAWIEEAIKIRSRH